MESDYPSKTKIRQCINSIISRSPKCFVCGKETNIELHHIYEGKLRKLSDRYGLTVCLCREHHRGKNGVHGGNIELDKSLKKLAKTKFIKYYGKRAFRELFILPKE